MVSFSQYQYLRTVYVDTGDSIPSTRYPLDFVAFKYKSPYLRYYKTSTLKSLLFIYDFDLNSFVVRKIDTCPNTFVRFPVDVLPMKNYDVFIEPDKIYIYDRIYGKQTSYRYAYGASKNFLCVNAFNDSVLLLSTFTNFHPLDGEPGLHLYIYNIITKNIIRSRIIRMPGIALANSDGAYVSDVGGKCYFIDPLTTDLYYIDTELNVTLIGTVDNSIDKKKNINYERESDKLIYGGWDRMYADFIANFGRDLDSLKSVIHSDEYTRDFYVNTVNNIKINFDYVEKMYPFNDSCLVVGIARANSGYKVRDVIMYNVFTQKMKSYYKYWLNDRKAICNKFEDYFPASFSNRNTHSLCFKADTILMGTFYDPRLFRPSSKDSLDLEIHKQILKNGYRWSLQEYKLE